MNKEFGSFREYPDYRNTPSFRPHGHLRGNFVAYGKQAARIRERRLTAVKNVDVCGESFEVFRGVYDTGRDTELMVETVAIGRSQTFLEVGCGAGAISILVAKRAKSGIGVDINPNAIRNAKHNARTHNARNVEFARSDVFQGIDARFDVIICNPPYNSYPTNDVVEKMFWDAGDKMKQRFFQGVRSRLTKGGRVYFGWADFADIDIDLPLKLGKEHGMELCSLEERRSSTKNYAFRVLEFRQATP